MTKKKPEMGSQPEPIWAPSPEPIGPPPPGYENPEDTPGDKDDNDRGVIIIDPNEDDGWTKI